MKKYNIPGFRSIITSQDSVFISFFDPPQIDVHLLTEVDKSKFGRVEISTATQSAFDSAGGHNVWKDADVVEDAAGYCDIATNKLTDWCVPDLDTLQMALYGKPPFTIEFNKPIEVRKAANPIIFEAYLANHRAYAKLEIEFEDLKTGRKSTREVEFGPDNGGGTVIGKYQKVMIVAPQGWRDVAVKIRVRVDGYTHREIEYSPYLFLCDVKLYETDEEGRERGSQFSENDGKFHWIRARTKAKLSKGALAFLKYDQHVDVVMTKQVLAAQAFFDEIFYENKNSDIDFGEIDSFTHYLLRGSKDFRNPNAEISVREYFLRNPEVEAAGLDPLVHYANDGYKNSCSLGIFEEKINEIWKRTGDDIPAEDANIILRRAQDLMVPMHMLDTRKLAVFVIPEHDAMSGGIYSMFSIANHARQMRRKHGFDIVMMTRPNRQGHTYVRNSSFRNSETVLRLEQLVLFKEVSELQIHIPEYAAVEFVRNLSPELLKYLMYRDNIHINILNQNTRLMPESEKFRDLRRISDTIGQSVSHHAFFGQDWANRYNLPSLLLPAYTDLSLYPPAGFDEKENIIIYSLDDAPYRDDVLDRLKSMSDYELVEIRDMPFDTYMDLATRCRFSVSFGEGFDGYVAQPIYQGGIGMALYTDEFFPDRSYMAFENFFASEAEMIDQIVPTIRRLEGDPDRYRALNANLLSKWNALYDIDDYVARIGSLMQMEYEIYPHNDGSSRGEGSGR